MGGEIAALWGERVSYEKRLIISLVITIRNKHGQSMFVAYFYSLVNFYINRINCLFHQTMKGIVKNTYFSPNSKESEK